MIPLQALRASEEDARAAIGASDAVGTGGGSAGFGGDINMADDDAIMQSILAQSMMEAQQAAAAPAAAQAVS